MKILKFLPKNQNEKNDVGFTFLNCHMALEGRSTKAILSKFFLIIISVSNYIF